MFELEERMAVSCYQLGWFYLQLTLEIYQDMIIWNELMLFDGTESKFNNNLVSNLVFGNRLLSERDGSWLSGSGDVCVKCKCRNEVPRTTYCRLF